MRELHVRSTFHNLVASQALAFKWIAVCLFCGDATGVNRVRRLCEYLTEGGRLMLFFRLCGVWRVATYLNISEAGDAGKIRFVDCISDQVFDFRASRIGEQKNGMYCTPVPEPQPVV